MGKIVTENRSDGRSGFMKAAQLPSPLFAPFALAGHALPNRIVMPPMGIHWAEGGVPGPEVAEYYARRARGGAGLLITEGTFIDHPVSAHNPGYLRMNSDATFDGWARVVRRVHEEGGLILPELWHCGLVYPSEELRKGNLDYDKRHGMVSPSGYIMPGQRVADPMTQAQIDDVIDSFARCAVKAVGIGFDGVELHGAHGFLIDQFFWSQTNDRNDAYGGSMKNRARFAAEVIGEVRRRLGPDVLLSIRISQWKMQDYDAKVARSPEEMADWLQPMVDAGIDMFDCSQRRYWEPEFHDSALNFAGWVKKLTGKPVITVGSVGLNGDISQSLIEGKRSEPAGIEELVAMVARGDVDLVAVGRSLIADPDWPKKVAEGRFSELKGFTPQVLKETSPTYDYL